MPLVAANHTSVRRVPFPPSVNLETARREWMGPTSCQLSRYDPHENLPVPLLNALLSTSAHDAPRSVLCSKMPVPMSPPPPCSATAPHSHPSPLAQTISFQPYRQISVFPVPPL